VKAVDLALKAGRKRQSEITRFVHHCYEDPARHAETIPVYENFCFALALLRSRTAENVLEAKALLEKLFAFRAGKEFPVYLHEYPHCRYAGLGSKLYPVVFFILRDFHTVLGEKLRADLVQLQNDYSFMEPALPKTPEEWAQFLIYSQIAGCGKADALKQWDPECLAFIGPQKQERGEPAVTLYDLFLGEWGGRFSTRALQDHPVHLQASLVYPGDASFSAPAQTALCQFWGSGHPTHSSLIHSPGQVIEEEGSLRIILPEKEVQEEIEAAYFCNHHASTEFFINGQKANTFQLGDTVQVISEGQTIEISFILESGEGQFWGHIYRGNRPGQLSCRGDEKYEAYDWVVGLRTIKRGASAVIRLAQKGGRS
jgi:hypothetical protein